MSGRPWVRTTGRVLGGTLLAAGTIGLVALGLRTGPPDPPSTTVPAPTPVSTTAQTAAAQQARLLSAEDQRLLGLVGSVRPGSPPYVQPEDGGRDTVVLTAGHPTYGLPDLVRLGAAERLPDHSVLITRNVFVAPGANLTVTAPDGVLRLRSGPAGFVSVVAWKAELALSGAPDDRLEITSWDPSTGAPDTVVDDGRAYVREVSGDMRLADVDASRLGFWAGRTGGVAWTGSSNHAAGGSIASSVLHDNHYGVFASEADGLVVSGSSFDGNAVDGLSLHRGTQQVAVLDSSASHNGRHGISADQGSESVTLTRVTAAGNTDHGIYFSGRPLSKGQSAYGAPLNAYGRLRVSGASVVGNGGSGIRVDDATDVLISGAHVSGGPDGIVLRGTSAPATVQDSDVAGAHRFGVLVGGGTATVAGNRVTGGSTGIQVRDAVADVRRNTVAGAGDHGIAVLGAAAGSTVSGNTVGGRGPSAVDVLRLATGVSVTTPANDVTGWVQDRDDALYWREFVPKHPMLLLWVVVLGAPLLMAVRGRRHRVTPGTAPYRDDLRRDAPAPRRVELGGNLVRGGQA